MIVVWSDTVPGRIITTSLDLGRGLMVRTKHVGSDLVAGFCRPVGGEVQEYGERMAGAREQAFARMVAQAESPGTDVIVAARFATEQISLNTGEVLAYGSAIRLAP